MTHSRYMDKFLDSLPPADYVTAIRYRRSARMRIDGNSVVYEGRRYDL